jgi:hypothetical protein
VKKTKKKLVKKKSADACLHLHCITTKIMKKVEFVKKSKICIKKVILFLTPYVVEFIGKSAAIKELDLPMPITFIWNCHFGHKSSDCLTYQFSL